MMKRRTFIASTLAAAGAASLSRETFSAAPAPKLFDTHCHFYTNDVAKYKLNPTGARYGAEVMTKKVMDKPMTPEVVFRFWDVVGVEMGTGVQYNSTYGTDNSYLLDVCRQHPKRALPVVILSPTDAATPDTLRKWAKEERLAAVRYSASPPASGDAPFFSAEAQNMWATANELGISIVLMILGNNTGPALRKVAEHAAKYPNVKIALDHIAFPHPERLTETFGLLPEHVELARHRNVYYKFTNFLVSEMEGYAKAAEKPFVDLKPFIEHMVKVFGADHLCWGSDYGNVEVDDVAYTRRFTDACAGLSAKDRAAFYADTARALFVPGGRGKAGAAQ
jgi:L-fuconolactonase